MKKKNLLFIFTDEQAAQTMRAYGNELIETPNMDALAAGGTVFENAYVTQPVCTPSRSTILTGLWPHTNGCTENNLPLREETKCFPETADFSEYKKAYFGKWHLGDEIFCQHGFDEWRSIDDGYNKYYSPGRDKKAISTYSQFLIENGIEPDTRDKSGFTRGICAKLPEELSKPHYLASETEKFLSENREDPFILYVNFFEPHMPYKSQRDCQYTPEEIPLPESFYSFTTENKKLALLRKGYFENGHSGLPLKTEADWKRIKANYWGLVSLVDSALGRIMASLEENGLSENTIIVYTSDHGDMMGAHRVLAKCVMNEEAVKVPLIFRIPGVPGGKRVSEPVSQIDLVPTLLDLLDKDTPDYLQGKSIRPVLENDGVPESDVFIEWNGLNSGVGGDIIGGAGTFDFMYDLFTREEILDILGDPVRTVISGGFKYNHSSLGRHELFDLKNDPEELINLAFKPEYAGIIKAMREKIASWQKSSRDIIPEIK